MRNFFAFLLMGSVLLIAIKYQYVEDFLTPTPSVGFLPDTMAIHWPTGRSWDIQSIDTMKYSRDLAREKLHDPSFVGVVEKQVENIAKTGANYVAIDTPYDEEFFPMLSIWVGAARKSGMHVWFRGNWSGWEGWFGYPHITREQHLEKTKEFISNHESIFQDSDIFSACPECENGGPGDPRRTGNVDGFRRFIIAEYQATQSAFQKINKKVSSNFYPMNADVARLVMDRETTKSMGSTVVIDHYVKSPDALVNDIRVLKEKTGGNIVLGEFGAPIPGIHGRMTETEQAQWIDSVLSKLILIDGITGVNYWSGTGGTTGIWDSGGVPLKAVSVLENYFKPKIFFGVVTDDKYNPIVNAKIVFLGKEFFSSDNGYFESLSKQALPLELEVSAPGFLDKNVSVREFGKPIFIVLKKKAWSWNTVLDY